MSTGFQLDENGIPWIAKSPEATLSYQFNLQDAADPWLAPGATLTAAAFTVPTGLTKVSETHDGTTATVKLSGGTAGSDYPCMLTWTDSTGNTDSRRFSIRVRRR